MSAIIKARRAQAAALRLQADALDLEADALESGQAGDETLVTRESWDAAKIPFSFRWARDCARTGRIKGYRCGRGVAFRLGDLLALGASRPIATSVPDSPTRSPRSKGARRELARLEYERDAAR